MLKQRLNENVVDVQAAVAISSHMKSKAWFLNVEESSGAGDRTSWLNEAT
jgi:hypothetical protein